MADIITNQVKTVERGGFPMSGNSPRLAEATITLGGITNEADDVVTAIKCVAETLVLEAGFEIVTATTNGTTASLGLGTGTEFMGETATNATAGVNVAGGYAKMGVLLAAGDTIDVAVSGDVGAAGVIRVWALLMDVKAMS